MLSTQDIQRIIPHRFPFLLVDRVLEMEAGQRIVALKNVTAGEPFFQGHFPDMPIMPGVLIVEAMAQAGAILLLSDGENAGKIPLFAGINECRFRSQVGPGDTLRLEVEFVARRGPIGKARARASVGETLAAEAELVFALAPGPSDGKPSDSG
jgi:3-hydroxyacyl-[acyl-carrier-protein] dehydratase